MKLRTKLGIGALVTGVMLYSALDSSQVTYKEPSIKNAEVVETIYTFLGQPIKSTAVCTDYSKTKKFSEEPVRIYNTQFPFIKGREELPISVYSYFSQKSNDCQKIIENGFQVGGYKNSIYTDREFPLKRN